MRNGCRRPSGARGSSSPMTAPHVLELNLMADAAFVLLTLGLFVLLTLLVGGVSRL